MSELLFPLQFAFFRQALAAVALVGALCGLVGVFIVLRRMSYIGHGLSHAVFGGAVVAFLMELNFYLGAGAWGFLAALLIEQTRRSARINADAAIGIVTTASFAVGVALISRARKFTRDFEAALFGNVLGVSPQDVLVVAGVALGVGALVFLFYRPLLFTTFDREVARAHGVRTEWMDTLLALILAATIIASLRLLGATLIAAAIVIPPVVVRLLTDRFGRLLVGSAAVGGLTGVAGIYLSFFLDVSSGATVVLVQAAVFVLVLGYALLRRRQVPLPQV